jgi:HAD superfamily hydrolase (TIGR01509 family)
MRGLVYRVKKLGYKTALLSNSWGNEYPREGWDEMFDVIVISGEVGMRKPERRIFQYTLDKLEIPGSNSVFVDDVKMNIDAGVEVGLIGIHHETYEKTRSELEILLGTNLE